MKPSARESRAQPHANEFLQLAADLQECVAFQPKKWRRVLESSSHLLDLTRDKNAATSLKRGAKATATHAHKYDTSTLHDDAGQRPSSRDEDAETDDPGRLPVIHSRKRAVPTLAEYLNQPQLIDEILREAMADKAPADTTVSPRSDQEWTDKLAPSEATDQSVDSTERMSTPPPVKPAPATRILSTVSPRTRDELARLPPLSSSDTKAIHEYERLAEDATTRQAMYAALHRFGHERATPSRFSRPRKLAVTNPTDMQAAKMKVVVPAKAKSPWKKRPAVAALSDLQCQRMELIRMALEDINALRMAPASPTTVTTKPIASSLLQSVPLDVRHVLATDHQQLVTLQKQSDEHERMAEHRVGQTLAEIQAFLPLDVIYQFGKGKFASPAQQRAASLLFRVGQRLTNNLLVQAVAQWQSVVLAMRHDHQLRSVVSIQCWWRQLLAVRTVQRRRRVRQQLERRQQLALRQLATKQTQSAFVITRAVRHYAEACQRHKLATRERAAITLQRFWRQQQQAWLALRHRIHQQRRHTAALRIQRILRGWLARRRRRLLEKIQRVEKELARRQLLQASRQRDRHRLGAVLALQRAVRKWIQRRIMSLRRRRAQFERDKAKILKVQAQFRGRKARKWVASHRRMVEAGVLVLQRAWRCYVARQAMAARREARRLQRVKWREEIAARRKARGTGLLAIAKVAASTTASPKSFRGKKKDATNGSTATAREIAAATTLQALWRGRRLRRRLKREHARALELSRRAVNKRRRLAAVAIQRRVRGMLGRVSAWNQMVQRSVLRIQSAWRGFQTRRRLRRMRAALLAIVAMQVRWRNRQREDRARVRGQAARRVQRAWRRGLGRRWLRRSVMLQQQRSEQHAAGAALLVLTRRRVGDELLLQSFVRRDVQHKPEGTTDPLFSVARSLFKRNQGTLEWTRRGYDGVWQQLYREAAGHSSNLEMDNSHFARWLKAVPKAFVHAKHLPTQTVDLVFAKMKEPKQRTIPFHRFNQAMAMLWRTRFKEEGSSADSATDQRLFLRFMRDFVLHGEKPKALVNEATTQRIAWAAGILRRLAVRIAQRQRHAVFVRLFRQQQQLQQRTRAAVTVQRQFRRHQCRKTLQATLAAMFTEFVDYKRRCVRFQHVESRRFLTCRAPGRRPAFLRNVERCARVVPLPYPGEEFHAFCLQGGHAAKVAACVYCVECEAPFCQPCFNREHVARATRQGHTQKKLRVCSHCESETATRECLVCGDGAVPYCDACFPFLHDADTGKQHANRRLVVACGECDERAAQWKCVPCDDIFCKRCLARTHAKGQRQSHECSRLSFLSVLQQQAQRKRDALAQQQHDTKKLERAARLAEEQRVFRLKTASATRIQAWVRSFQTRQRGKAYMRLVRQTHVAKAQRIRDSRVRNTIVYRIRRVVGLAPPLKSDTQEESDRLRERRDAIKRALLLDRRQSKGATAQGDSAKRKRKKRWTKRSRAAVEKAARTWLCYDAHVRITGPRGSAYRGCVGTIVSVQSLFLTGFVLVFVAEAHKAVAVEWTNVAAYDADERLRVAYVSPSRVAIDKAVDLRARLTRVVTDAVRRTKLLYAQSIEFHDIVHLAWVVRFNKLEQKEEYWNVVLDTRTFDVPKAMLQIERMESEDREKLDARVALAQTKLESLLHPYQPRDKPMLAQRRNAVVPLPVALKNSGNHQRLKTEAEAMSCARFWHETIMTKAGAAKCQRFLAASGPTVNCWRLVKLLQWLELHDDAVFETQLAAFFAKTGESQTYIMGELAAELDANLMKDARANLDRLLKIKEETMQLLISKAEQAAQEREEQEKGKTDS